MIFAPQKWIPESRFGKFLSFLFVALFLLFPFQHRHRGFGKNFLKKMYAADLSFPEGFSKTMSLEYSDLLLFGIIALLFFKFRLSLRAFFWEGPSKFLSLFLAVSAFSILASEWSGHLFQYVWLLKFTLSALLFCALRVSFSPVDFPSLFRKVAWIFLCTALVVGLLGIAQYFLQAEVGLSGLGESCNKTFIFVNPSQKRWIFDSILLPSQVLLRSCSTLYHPNALGGFLFLSLLFTSYLYFTETKRSTLLFLSGCVFLQCFALFTTYSRSGILALIVSMLLLSLLQVRKDFKKVLQFGLILLCSACLCLSLFYSQIFARGGIVNYTPHVQMADQERVTYQKAAIEMEQDHPWLGVGFNNFQFHIKKYTSQVEGLPLVYKVHNIFLLILSETGIIGMSCFILFLGTLVVQLLRSPKTLERSLLLSILAGLILIGGCDMYLLENAKLRIVFFAFLGFISIYTCPKFEVYENCSH